MLQYYDSVHLASDQKDLLISQLKAEIFEIEQRDKDYLALRDQNGTYYLNGNWRIDYPQRLDICGTTFHYERKYKNKVAKGPLTLFAPESVRALGPTTCSLFVVVSVE